MARRGRPPKIPLPLPANATDSAVDELMGAQDRTKVVICCLCNKGVPSIPRHLEQEHFTVRVEDYQAQFPTALLEPAAVKEERKERRRQAITVTEREIANHPCGADGAIIEKNLAKEEQSLYRNDCAALIKRGYQAGHELASVAHAMTLARRLRLDIETTRADTEGQVYRSDAFDLLKDLEARIEKGIQSLEKARTTRMNEAQENPLAAMEEEMAGAEAWVQEHIGEFNERCPGCGQILTPPALPHWAFEPVKNDQGVLYWPVWSQELWKLVTAREIPLWQMCYVLRTSPEGLRFTARRKGVDWPGWIQMEWEEQQLRTRLLADDRGAPIALDPARRDEA